MLPCGRRRGRCRMLPCGRRGSGCGCCLRLRFGRGRGGSGCGALPCCRRLNRCRGIGLKRALVPHRHSIGCRPWVHLGLGAFGCSRCSNGRPALDAEGRALNKLCPTMRAIHPIGSSPRLQMRPKRGASLCAYPSATPRRPTGNYEKNVVEISALELESISHSSSEFLV